MFANTASLQKKKCIQIKKLQKTQRIATTVIHKKKQLKNRLDNINSRQIDKAKAANTGLAKVVVQCSADKFMVRIPNFAKPCP